MIKKGLRTHLETENVVHRDCKAAVTDVGKLQPRREGKIRYIYYEPDIPERAALIMQRRCVEHINSRTW